MGNEVTHMEARGGVRGRGVWWGQAGLQLEVPRENKHGCLRLAVRSFTNDLTWQKINERRRIFGYSSVFSAVCAVYSHCQCTESKRDLNQCHVTQYKMELFVWVVPKAVSPVKSNVNLIRIWRGKWTRYKHIYIFFFDISTFSFIETRKNSV